MKAIDRQFLEIIEGRKQFIVPVFQRDYSWHVEQWEQLWHDVLRASSTEIHGGHFLGSIVYVGGGGGAVFNSLQVIDGQQRLTSLLLLLTALRDHIRKTGWQGGDDSPTADSIDVYYLRNSKEQGERRNKLRLRRHDNHALKRLLNARPAADTEEGPSASLIQNAYDYFIGKLQDADLDAVYRGIASLRVVDVTLTGSTDNPQLVFESLNSTGAALTQSDLVRNYLLMGQSEQQQTRLYTDYWMPLEAEFRRADVSSDRFLREYVALKSGASKALRDHEVYDGFKRYWNPSKPIDIEDLLKDLRRFSTYYLAVVSPGAFGRDKGRKIANALRDARANGIVHALLGMQLLDCHEAGFLSKAQLAEAFRLIESYIVRRSVLGWSSRNYWANFASIARHVQGNPGSDHAMSAVRVAFAQLAQRFPTNEEFKSSILEVDLYRRRNCHQILGRLENDGHKEPSPVQDYSVEHVMPQAPGTMWREMLGEDWERVHGAWLHRLGNLTLTAYNSTLSNRPFVEKKTTKGGFNQSAARLNEYVRAQATWAEEQMKERGEQLARKALRVWPGHGADEQALRRAKVADLKRRAAARPWTGVQAKGKTEQLIEDIVDRTEALGEVVALRETKETICFYRPPEFFLEARAMKGWVRLLLPLDFDDVGEAPSKLQVSDATKWSFFVGAVHKECGVLVRVEDAEQAAAAMPIVRRAFETVVA